MKLFTLTFGLLLLSSFSYSQNREITFETGNFADLKSKAKKENKIIFIDAYTTWCGPCKWMAKNIFTNDTVADYFNSTFVNAKIDMEKGEGIDIAKMYDVQCYPNFLFLDSEGKLVHRVAGSMGMKEFMATAKAATDSEKQFAHFIRDFEKKKNDTQFLTEYLDAISTTCLKYDNVLATYFASQEEKNLSNRANWNLMYAYTGNYKSREFEYLLKNISLYERLYTADSVNIKIENVMMSSAQTIIYNKSKNASDVDLFLKDVATMEYAKKDALLFNVNMLNYQAKKDWAKYAELLVLEGDKYISGIRKINSVAWTLYEKSDDVAALTKAAGWLKKELNRDVTSDDYAYFDTYACVLFKLKKKDEAKAVATKAIDLAKQGGMEEHDYYTTVELLTEIEKLK